MASEVAKPMSPMEEFQDNLKKSLRDDIARLLPEAALADMIKRVVEEEFFKKQIVANPQHTSYNSEPRTLERPTVFQELVVKAVAPIMEREAAKLIERLEYKIADQIKQTVEEGATAVVMRALTGIINSSFSDSEQRMRQAIVDLLKRNGLQINPY